MENMKLVRKALSDLKSLNMHYAVERAQLQQHQLRAAVERRHAQQPRGPAAAFSAAACLWRQQPSGKLGLVAGKVHMRQQREHERVLEIFEIKKRQISLI